MCEERVVVLRRGAGVVEGGLGVSLLGESGPAGPHVIYRVEDDSPAARSGEVEAGDVILKVNGTDVNRFSTREVLKCLRLSSDPVTLKIKRDPQVAASVRRFLSTSLERHERHERHQQRHASNHRHNNDRSCSSPPSSSSSTSSSSTSARPAQRSHPPSGSSSEALLPASPPADPAPLVHPAAQRTTPKFEAYMMTGDLILNLSRVEHHNHHHHHNRYHRYNSTPVSPVERQRSVPEPVQRYNSSPADPHHTFNSQPTSPGNGKVGGGGTCAAEAGTGTPESGAARAHTVRTSRSEDQLQFQKNWSMCAVGVELEEDVTSSLNTLLDTRPDSSCSHTHTHSHSHSNGERDRIVWTYNAPASNGSGHHSNSTSISDNISQRSSSPASPTSMSSSVMSSRATPTPHHRLPPPTSSTHPASTSHLHRNLNGDMSLSEAISNMSSPDYQDQDDIFDTGRECPRMELSDPSDSDSTILVSEPCHKRVKSNQIYNGHSDGSDVTLNGDDYRIVIQVKGPEKQNGDAVQLNGNGNIENGCVPSDTHSCQEESIRDQQPLEMGSDEGSDAESLHSFHYSPKAVDIPSAVRLAKRLYHLDGFKKSDVSRHLSKNNEFSRAVAEEYVKHFDLTGATLDIALRTFLSRFALSGETQERERVLVHFSRRYLDCNPGAAHSQDAVHTLTCALMLLNTDLHGAAGGGGANFRRMTCAEFVDNLADLNDGGNFPRDTLEKLYRAIRSQPLQWALDSEGNGGVETAGTGVTAGGAATAVLGAGGANPFLDLPDQSRAVEYKKGYVMRKCCYDANAKKTPFGKRGWKMFYCTLRDLVLYLHKDDHGFGRSQMSDSLHNAIRIHHALATRASDYSKKQHVFRLQTADQAEFLFQTSDSKELASWIETINFVCAAYSSQPLASAVGSQRKFQRPLLPCSHTKLSMRQQLSAHDERVALLEDELTTLRASRDNTHAHRDKEQYLIYEVKRYRTYAAVLRARGGGAGAADEAPAVPDRATPALIPRAEPPPP